MRNIFEYNDNFEKYRHVKSVLQYGDKMMCPVPKISVIIPVYGNPKFFVHSFNSVIHQDADFSYEVIIVDNTPLDDTKSEVLKFVEKAKLSYVFYYRNKENIGMAGNWNRGIELARAELITFCHDDDMLFPNCLSKLWLLHLKYPEKFIIPSFKTIDEKIEYPLGFDNTKKYRGKECFNYDKIDILMSNPSNGVGCLFYKKHLIELGGYNEEYYPTMDKALHAKYIFIHGAKYYRNILYCYRITTDNYSNEVYREFITNSIFYAKCMQPYIKLPSFMIKAIIHTYKTYSTISLERVWAKKTEFSVKPTVIDKLINKCLTVRRCLKKLF